MKLFNFKDNEDIHIGVVIDEKFIDLTQTAFINNINFPRNINELIDDYDLSIINDLLSKDVIELKEDKIIFTNVINNPEKILCIGLNYSEHRNEVENFTKEKNDFSVVFNKLNNSLCSHNTTIKIPNATKKLDYEVELVIVIGKEAKEISVEDADKYIFGYTIGNDLSARDLQLQTSQWFIGKTCDDFAPTGPYIVPKDYINENQLNIQCFVNNELRQSSNTKNMIFNCQEIVSYLSNIMTLKSGDLIFTGTPNGVILGYNEQNQVWLKSGDTVKCYIENIGYLENKLY